MTDANLMIVFQLTIIFLLVVLFVYILYFNRSLKLAKRIGKYSVESLTNDPTSLFDQLHKIHSYLQTSLSKMLLKIKPIEEYSHRYSQYIDYMDKKRPIDFVSNKILISSTLLLLNVVANLLELQVPSILEMIVTVLIGFYILDIYNNINAYVRRKKIERDLLNTIIMLNNAFKSGRSTMQAIEIVKNGSEGPIKAEFAKMYKEICYGLSLETVFMRFANRVNIEEISYITSSLTILNKAGGNIVKVFTSIERSLFSKQKLELEMRALTASARVMSKILLFLPFIFAGIILLLNPTYFDSFFDNFIGLSIFSLIIVFYCLYAVLVRRLMRVRLWYDEDKKKYYWYNLP